MVREKHKRSFLSFLTQFFMLIISVIITVLLVVSYLSVNINPNVSVIPSLLGIIAPVLYVLEVVLFLYWTIKWKIHSLIILIVLLIGLPKVELFFKADVSKDYASQQKSRSSDFTVMSHNVSGFISPSRDDFSSTMSQSIDFINSLSADILCLQEFQTTPLINPQMVDEKLSKYKYKRVKYKILNYDNNSGWGLAIYSKYPIINSLHISFDDSNNSAMWADIKINKDTIRVYNIHLQSTRVDQNEQDFILQNMLVDSTTELSKTKMGIIANKLANNAKIRADQVDSLLVHLQRNPYPVILCGDFNDTPMSYTYNSIKGDLKDAFCEVGEGFSPTYAGLLRIDYVLYGNEFEAVSYATSKSEYSDHKPVVVKFKEL